MKLKRLCFVNTYELWGGGEKWHFEMALFCAKRGHPVTVITPKNGELAKRIHQSSIDNISLIHLNLTKHSYWNPIDQFKIFCLFKKNQFDSIVFNALPDVRALAYRAKRSGIQKVIYRAGMPAAPKEKSSYLKAFQQGLDFIVGISRENIDIFKRQSPSLLERVQTKIIPNGIDMECFEPKKWDAQDVVVFGNCTRLSDQKGLDFFLQVVKKLQSKKNQLPLFKVLIAGDGELRDELRLMSQEMGLQDIVNFCGFIEKSQDFYPRLDFLLFTSKFEGSARTLIEAGACAVPAVAFNTSSMSEMIEDEKTGYLVSPFDIEQMTLCCEKLLLNQELRNDMGTQARRFMENHYNQKKVYESWYQFLTENK